jgi:hypothetical protein
VRIARNGEGRHRVDRSVAERQLFCFGVNQAGAAAGAPQLPLATSTRNIVDAGQQPVGVSMIEPR